MATPPTLPASPVGPGDRPPARPDDKPKDLQLLSCWTVLIASNQFLAKCPKRPDQRLLVNPGVSFQQHASAGSVPRRIVFIGEVNDGNRCSEWLHHRRGTREGKHCRICGIPSETNGQSHNVLDQSGMHWAILFAPPSLTSIRPSFLVPCTPIWPREGAAHGRLDRQERRRESWVV